MRKFFLPGVTATFAAGFALAAAAGFFSPAARANNVIVLNSAEATLSLIDETTRQVIGTVPTGKEPHHLMVTPDNSSLIVANSVSNNLMFVDPKTGQVQRWVENIEDPYQIGFSPDRKWLVTTGLRLDRLDIYHYDGQKNQMALASRLPLAVMPLAISPRSSTRTERPREASSYATESPAIPDPTTTASASALASNAGALGGRKSIQQDLVRSLATFIGHLRLGNGSGETGVPGSREQLQPFHLGYG